MYFILDLLNETSKGIKVKFCEGQINILAPKNGFLGICDLIRVTVEIIFGHFVGFTLGTKFSLIVRVTVENFGLFLQNLVFRVSCRNDP